MEIQYRHLKPPKPMWKLSLNWQPVQNKQREKPIRKFSIDPKSSIRTSIAATVFADPVSETPIVGSNSLFKTSDACLKPPCVLDRVSFPLLNLNFRKILLRNPGHFPDLRTPQPATGVSCDLRARSVPKSVRKKGGCPRECPRRCLRGPSGPRAPECSKGVPRGSPECQKGVWGRSRDTFWTLRSPGPEGPRRHPVGHPRFSGTLSGTPPGTLRARRARETPVAGRGVCNPRSDFWPFLWRHVDCSLQSATPSAVFNC